MQPTIAGVARYVAALANHQAGEGHEVHVACPEGGVLAEWLAPEVTHHGWAVPRQPGPRHLGAARTLRRLVDLLGPDAVHLHSAAAGLSGRLALRGQVPTVFQPHAWSFLAATGVQATLALAWERWAVRWTDVTIAVSIGEAEQATGARVGGRIAVIENGVDPAVWSEVDDAGRCAARRELGLGAGPLVVCVGRLSMQKGQDLLLEAWPLVTAAVPGATLHLVGDDQGLALPTVDGVVVHGARDDAAAWYAAADVVVLPSRWEGLPLTLLEAMARGRAVVAHDVVGCREVLAHVPAALAEAGDTVGLAAALVRRLEDRELRQREGTANRERVISRYALQTVLQRATNTTLSHVSDGRGRG